MYVINHILNNCKQLYIFLFVLYVEEPLDVALLQLYKELPL